MATVNAARRNLSNRRHDTTGITQTRQTRQTTQATQATQATQGRAARDMGASRDYTTGNAEEYGYRPVRDRGANRGHGRTAVLERRRGDAAVTAAPSRAQRVTRPRREELYTTPGRPGTPVRPARTTGPETPARPARRGRLGSQQVVSHRGRQLLVSREPATITKLSAYSLVLLIAGVCLAMWLSGVATSQTFKIQTLAAQEATLDNQLETLNRDLENVRSSADVARRAAESKMGVPVQAGIVEVKENGDIAAQRQAKPETESIIDVNGAPVRPGQASSDPDATKDVEQALTSAPQGQAPAGAPVPQLPARAPYAATATD